VRIGAKAKHCIKSTLRSLMQFYWLIFLRSAISLRFNGQAALPWNLQSETDKKERRDCSLFVRGTHVRTKLCSMQRNKEDAPFMVCLLRISNKYGSVTNCLETMTQSNIYVLEGDSSNHV
jgi:hypothetical protein